eukprot:g26660.t1
MRHASMLPQPNGKRQLHDGHASSSSDDEDGQRDGHHHKTRQSTTEEKERSIPNLETPDITRGPAAPTLLATSRPVILAGDFKCVIDVDGRSRGADSKLDTTSRFLMEMVQVAKLHDVFICIPVDGVLRRYT